MSQQCSHVAQIKITLPTSHVCEECLALGDRWMHLRMCLICGHIGCCDDSKNKHATKHFHTSSHALIRSIEPGESWVWCYIDNIIVGNLED